jgi:hypothetical protein
MKKLVFAIMMLVASLVSAQEAVKTISLDVDFVAYDASAINNPADQRVTFQLAYSDLGKPFKLGRWLMCPNVVKWYDKHGSENLAIHAHPCYPVWWEKVDFSALAAMNYRGEYFGSGVLNQSRSTNGNTTVRFGRFGHHHFDKD